MAPPKDSNPGKATGKTKANALPQFPASDMPPAEKHDGRLVSVVGDSGEALSLAYSDGEIWLEIAITGELAASQPMAAAAPQGAPEGAQPQPEPQPAQPTGQPTPGGIGAPEPGVPPAPGAVPDPSAAPPPPPPQPVPGADPAAAPPVPEQAPAPQHAPQPAPDQQPAPAPADGGAA